jgi:hypothetical protein
VASQVLICDKCGSHVAVGAGIAEVIGKGQRIPRSPMPMIEPGKVATIDGTQFVVLGRVLYSGSDDEETFEWNEWQLGAADGRMMWLSFDENGFALFQKLRFRNAFDAFSDAFLDLGEGKRAVISERYPASIVAAEGELTWRARPGEKVFMAEAAAGGMRYSIQQSDEELEVYEGRLLADRAVAEAFNDQEWLKKINSNLGWRTVRSWIGVLCILTAVLSAAGAVYAMNSGDDLEPQFLTLSSAQPVGGFTVEFDQVERPAQVTVALRGALAENQSVDIDVSITSPDGMQDDLFVQELWHETGYDDEGFWRETQYETSEMFVPMQTGLHKIQLDLDTTTPVSNVNLAVTVRRNTLAPIWFMLYMGLTGMIGVITLFSAFSKRAGA